MTSNLERIRYELELAGYKLDQEDFDYSNEVGKAVYEICEVFSKQGHSGMSAGLTLQLIKTLLVDEDILTPLTDNPREWVDVAGYNKGSSDEGKPMYQSKRKFSCFTTDFKTYYDIDESTGNAKRILHKLKKYGEK